MFCTQCGSSLASTARFCPQCGKPVDVPPALPPAFTEAAHRLVRIAREKKIAGVCAGFARYFRLDVTLVRLLFLALLVLPPGVGLIGYVVAWIAMPLEP